MCRDIQNRSDMGVCRAMHCLQSRCISYIMAFQLQYSAQRCVFVWLTMHVVTVRCRRAEDAGN